MRYYGVAIGHVPGVYTVWSEALEQVTDIKGPKYRKFDSRKEAEDFVKSGGKSPVVKVGESEAPSAKKAKLEKKVNSEGSGSGGGGSGVLKVWTDGSSRGNGKVGACAGLGVYFGYDDERCLPFHPLLPFLANTVE
jgi:ribonuclease HI